MSGQTVSNKIGNCIGEARRRLLDRVKEGADLRDSISIFIGEVRLGLMKIEEDERLKSEEPDTIG
jgi:hypothetical protein